jgi:hypothetical protein
MTFVRSILYSDKTFSELHSPWTKKIRMIFHVNCPLAGHSWPKFSCVNNFHGRLQVFAAAVVQIMVFLGFLHHIVCLLRRFGTTNCLCLHCGRIVSGGQRNDWTETYSELRSAIFWDFVQLTLVVCYRRFGPIFKVQAECLTLKVGSDRLAQNFGNKLAIYAV